MPRTKLREPKKQQRKSEPVVVKRPGVNHLDPMLRREVMRLAKGDATRVEVVSKTEAIVR